MSPIIAMLTSPNSGTILYATASPVLRTFDTPVVEGSTYAIDTGQSQLYVFVKYY